MFFLTSNVFDESRFTWRCFGEMPRATDKSSAPCTQVDAEPEMEMEPELNTELRLKPLKPQIKKRKKCLSNRLGIYNSNDHLCAGYRLYDKRLLLLSMTNPLSNANEHLLRSCHVCATCFSFVRTFPPFPFGCISFRNLFKTKKKKIKKKTKTKLTRLASEQMSRPGREFRDM